MRASNKEVTHSVYTSVTKKASTEELIVISEYKQEKRIKVTVGYFEEDGRLMDQVEVVIYDEYYEMLMSDSPNFASGKPLNEYRESDLWYVIDLLHRRAEV